MFDISNLTNIDTPTSNRPYGVMRDDVLPGDETGTEVEEQVYNDLYYPLVAIMDRMGLTPDDVDEGVDTSQVADAVEGLGLEANDNLLFNSDFRIWQRGLSISVSTGLIYTCDRFRLNITGYTSGSATISKDTTNQENNFQNCASLDFSSLVYTTAFSFKQMLETKNVVKLRNKKIILKIRIKASAAADIFLAVRDGTDIDAEPVTSITQSLNSMSLTTSYQDFYLSHTVQSGANSLVAFIESNSPSYGFAGQIYIQYMGLYIVDGNFKDGSAAKIPYKQRNITEEIQLCQRYFEKSYNLDIAPGTASQPATSAVHLTIKVPSGTDTKFLKDWWFKVRKRINPAVVIYDPVSGNSGQAEVNGTAATIAGTAQTESKLLVDVSSSSTLAVKSIAFHATADAEI